MKPPALKPLLASLTLAGSLLLISAPAWAQSGADEYIPQVPTATGNKSVTKRNALAAQPNGSSSKAKKDKRQGGAAPGAGGGGGGGNTPSSGGSGGDQSSSVFDTLLQPVVLLLLAGVLAVGVGMAMARRSRDRDEDELPGSKGARPLTPHGEIVGPNDDTTSL